MTAPSTTPLVELVARALCIWRNGKRSSIPFELMIATEQDAYRDQAQAAIAACHAEELAEALRNLAAAFVNPYDGGEYEAGEVPVLDEARALLNRLDGKPMEDA